MFIFLVWVSTRRGQKHLTALSQGRLNSRCVEVIFSVRVCSHAGCTIELKIVINSEIDPWHRPRDGSAF